MILENKKKELRQAETLPIKSGMHQDLFL